MTLVNKRYWTSIICLGLFLGLSAQKDTIPARKNTFPIKSIEIGLLAASQVGLSVFWYDDFGKFSFRDDFHQWKQMDKLGHTMSAFQVARSNVALCKLSGLRGKDARQWAWITTSIFYTGIEVLDGFSNEYGFSWSDMAANGLGIGLAMVPDQIQRRFSLRYSYGKTVYPQFRPQVLGTSNLERIFKDYNGQTYWLSVWQKPQKSWYHFIGLSIGYGADGLLGGSENPAQNENGESIPQVRRARQFYLALDYNLEGLAPNHPKWRKVLRLLDFIKIPLPAVQFQQGEGVRFKPFFF